MSHSRILLIFAALGCVKTYSVGDRLTFAPTHMLYKKAPAEGLHVVAQKLHVGTFMPRTVFEILDQEIRRVNPGAQKLSAKLSKLPDSPNRTMRAMLELLGVYCEQLSIPFDAKEPTLASILDIQNQLLAKEFATPDLSSKVRQTNDALRNDFVRHMTPGLSGFLHKFMKGFCWKAERDELRFVSAIKNLVHQIDTYPGDLSLRAFVLSSSVASFIIAKEDARLHLINDAILLGLLALVGIYAHDKISATCASDAVMSLHAMGRKLSESFGTDGIFDVNALIDEAAKAAEPKLAGSIFQNNAHRAIGMNDTFVTQVATSVLTLLAGLENATAAAADVVNYANELNAAVNSGGTSGRAALALEGETFNLTLVRSVTSNLLSRATIASGVVQAVHSNAQSGQMATLQDSVTDKFVSSTCSSFCNNGSALGISNVTRAECRHHLDFLFDVCIDGAHVVFDNSLTRGRDVYYANAPSVVVDLCNASLIAAAAYAIFNSGKSITHGNVHNVTIGNRLVQTYNLNNLNRTLDVTNISSIPLTINGTDFTNWWSQVTDVCDPRGLCLINYTLIGAIECYRARVSEATACLSWGNATNTSHFISSDTGVSDLSSACMRGV